jgi:hypothetical protein
MTIFANSDISINLTIADENGAAIDLSAVETLNVFAYIKKEKILQSWTLSDVIITSPSAGECTCIFDRANNTETGRLFLEIQVGTTDANFAGGVKVSVQSDIEIATVKNSVQ